MSEFIKTIDRARKLKALADRGKEGEMETAKVFYKRFLKDNNISEDDIDAENFKRTFRLADSEYAVILSYIIMSVNPFTMINRAEDGKYIVILDDEDFVEVEHKFMAFHNLFKKDEKRMLSDYEHLSKDDYEKEKLLFLTGFMGFHTKYFAPDEYAVKKQRGVDGMKVNPDMADVINVDKKPIKENSDEQPQPVMFNNKEISKITEYQKNYTVIEYARAKKTLSEKFI